jgi:hypothetical protein
MAMEGDSVRWLYLAICITPTLVISGLAAGDELPTVVAVQAKKTLKLYASPDGTGGIVASISGDQVTTPVPVEQVSSNLMLKVTINGQTGWIQAHTVKTDKPPSVTIRCDPLLTDLEPGGTRGLGEEGECKP